MLDSEGARYDELGDMYTLPISQEWKFSGAIFEPLTHAYNGMWHAQDLERTGVAMQAWRGDGHADLLNASRLKRHRFEKPRAPTVNKERTERWQTGAAIINDGAQRCPSTYRPDRRATRPSRQG